MTTLSLRTQLHGFLLNTPHPQHPRNSLKRAAQNEFKRFIHSHGPLSPIRTQLGRYRRHPTKFYT
ncbi:MAG: hypothetical protein VX112_00410 [Pseudomonadota bacterium]|nr:hypothetical protein [Pseudomonadota bacterium]